VDCGIKTKKETNRFGVMSLEFGGKKNRILQKAEGRRQ
jgi:hypothetical protein